MNIYRQQRRRYHIIRERAETDPNIVSIIIDGMDQNTTSMPHFKHIKKSDVNLWQLRTHLTGAIVHGHSSYAYLDYLQWPHDPNLTCNILLKVNMSKNC